MYVYVCVSGGNKYSFYEKFGVLRFLETPVLRFALLPYYRRLSDRKFIGKIGISPATMTEIFKFWDNTTNNLTSGQVLERIHARTNNFGVE